MSQKVTKGRNLKKTIIFGAIAKSIDQDDGTVILEGYASSGAVDAQGEVIAPEAMRKALPDYMAFGNIREMHKATAAGVAMHAEVQEDGRTFLRAHVVDPVAVLKVRTKVYKGFSIGGYVEKRDPDDEKVITDLRLVEISLVDRPCNPDAVFACYKAEGADGENENDGATGDGEEAPDGEGGGDAPKDDDDDGKGKGKAKDKGAKDGDDAGDEGETDDDADDDAKEKAAAAGDLAKGCYSITNLARLCEGLDEFASYQSFEASFEQGSEDVANEARALAIKLYGLLLKLVGADVARAKERLGAALEEAKADKLEAMLEGALAKVRVAAPPATPVDVPAVLKAAGVEDDALDSIEKVAAELVRLRAVEKAWKDAPAPAKGALAAVPVSKVEDGDPLTTKTEEPATPATPLDAIKKTIQTGGTALRGGLPG